MYSSTSLRVGLTLITRTVIRKTGGRLSGRSEVRRHPGRLSSCTVADVLSEVVVVKVVDVAAGSEVTAVDSVVADVVSDVVLVVGRVVVSSGAVAVVSVVAVVDSDLLVDCSVVVFVWHNK